MTRRRVLLAGDFLVHERTNVQSRSTLCGVPIPIGSRVVDSTATCATCMHLAAKRQNTTMPRARTPLEEFLGVDEPEWVIVDLRCVGCGEVQTERLDGDAPARAALAGVVCATCGTRGRFTFAPRSEPDPVERPPHPEEP